MKVHQFYKRKKKARENRKSQSLSQLQTHAYSDTQVTHKQTGDQNRYSSGSSTTQVGTRPVSIVTIHITESDKNNCHWWPSIPRDESSCHWWPSIPQILTGHGQLELWRSVCQEFLVLSLHSSAESVNCRGFEETVFHFF